MKRWACKVAELRLWLALIIDADIPVEELHIRDEPLLPNFSFNIRHGDSIVQDVGGMNLAQIRAVDSRVLRSSKQKITTHKNEKLKFYNGEEERKYAEEEDVQRAEHGIFREILQNYETQISKDIRSVEAWLEDPAEQLTLDGITRPEPRQLSIETQQKQQELKRHKENREQVRRTLTALPSQTTQPFVWDIAFVEIFSQRDGFDIIVENPPYIRQEDIRDLMLPRDEGIKTGNKKAYKAKLERSVYQAFPNFFGYQPQKDINPDKPESAVKRKLSRRSDLYIYFYFHGLYLLNSKGTFCSITSNSWLDTGFGANLKEFLLTQCHLRLVIDNTARRSFKGVNINTIISVASYSGKNSEVNLKKATRFVNFTVPFEAILDPIIFYEIETVLEKISRQEHRVYSLLQRELFDAGVNEQSRYAGEGWGKYFRAPHIYWTILKRGIDKLVSVGKIADVQLGIKTGANGFFILDQSTISKWNIETEFLKPLITNLEESQSILIRPEQLSSHVFMCGKERSELIGTAALDYIKWGETREFHETRSCRGRQRWYDVGQRPIPYLNFPRRTPATTAKTFYTSNGCYALDKFVDVHVPANMRIPFCFYLNSTIFQLIVNVNGRSSLGYGTLEVQTSDLKTLPCVNLNTLNISGGGRLALIFLNQKIGMSWTPHRRGVTLTTSSLIS